MKKLFLVLLILALAATPLLLTACSNVSQRDKLMRGYSCSDDGYELFTYKVFHDEAIVGEMTMKFEPLQGRTVTLPSAEGEPKSAENVTGTLLSTHLTISGGDTITSRVVYDGDFAPIYSYKRTYIGGVTKEMQVSYEGKYLYAKLFVNGEEVSCVEEKASGCFDNEMLYALVRASDVSSSSYTLSFSVVNALTAAKETLSITKTSEVKEHIDVLEPTEYELAEGETTFTVPCYAFTISTDNLYASSYKMTVTKDRQTVKNEKIDIVNVKKVITTITEGEYKYILSDVKIV